MSSLADLPVTLLITCEHGGNDVPEKYKTLFEKDSDVLFTHRGYDIGALDIARYLSEHLKSELFYSTITRLLVEANRSIDNAQLFSEFTSSLSENEKDVITEKYYHPYRKQVESFIKAQENRIIHIGMHSFTPVLNGAKRDVDLGVLYDQTRNYENQVSEALLSCISTHLPELKVKANEPYKGTDDGFTTYLRTITDPNKYAGIEIEINQKYFTDDVRHFESIKSALAKCIRLLIASQQK
jgi:predicted N-formylglutamate amidohydrolase